MMKLFMSLVILVFSGLITHTTAQITNSVEIFYYGGSETTKRLNVNEDFQLVCDVSTSGSLGKLYYLRWYKMQESPTLLGRDENLLSDPFDKQPDKYKVGFAISTDGTTTTFTLDVKGVTVNDAGSYYCVVGEDTKTMRSANAELFVNPVKADTTISELSSNAPEDEAGVKKYENGHYPVKCTARVKSNSGTLKLMMFLGEDDITQEFSKTTVHVQWEGVDGSQTPVQNFELSRDHWSPSGYGPNTLKCVLMDGDVELDQKTLDVAKDEPPVTASLNCTSSYKGLLKEGVLDYSFVCHLYDFAEQGELGVTYEFQHDGKKVSLTTGEDNYSRKTSKFGEDEFIMNINRITLGMTKNGGVTYNITLVTKQDGRWEPVPDVSTTFTAEAVDLGLVSEATTNSILGTYVFLASFLSTAAAFKCIF